MKRILIQLNTSLDVFNTRLEKLGQVETNEKRIEQIYRGVKKFLVKKCKEDIIFFDNTIPKEKNIPEDLEKLLKDNNITINHDLNNNYGGFNKGAGLLEVWTSNKEILSNYEYILYFEPRQLIINFNFIENFLENPRNLFVYGEGKKCFITGLFGIKTSLLLEYIKFSTPESLVNRNIFVG